jgi:hypothetical protein
VSYVWGKRNHKTAKKLRDKLKSQGITYDSVYTDKWDSFIAVFQADNHIIGRENTKGIEGNNYRLGMGYDILLEKPVVFPKPFNQITAFELAFYYINFGIIQ